MQGRKLGYWETLNALVHDELQSHGNLVLLATINGVASEHDLNKLLRGLFLRHPALRAVLNKDEDGYYAMSLTALFEDIPVSFHNDGDAKALFDVELTIPLETRRYLWRINIIRDHVNSQMSLVATFSHAVGDGLSILSFVKAFVDGLNQMADDKYVELESLPLLPPVETHLVKEKFSQLNRSMAESELFSEQTAWPFHKKAADIAQRKTGTVFQRLNDTELQSIKMFCKQHGLTVQDALNAALLGALNSVLDSSIKTTLCTPISLRTFSEPVISAEDFGCNVTMVTTGHQVDDFSFIDSAKAYHQQLRESIHNAGQYPEKFTLSDAMPYIEQCKMERNQFFMGCGITNVGVHEMTGDHFSLADLYFCASRQAADFALLLCVVTINDHLFITYSFTEPEMDKAFVEDIADAFRKILLNQTADVHG